MRALSGLPRLTLGTPHRTLDRPAETHSMGASSRSASRATGTSSLWLALCAALVLVIASTPTSHAVKRHDFKTCSQSGFCRRNRAFADRAAETGQAWQSPYALAAPPQFARGSLSADVVNALFPNIKFSLEVRFHQDGTARVLMDEVDGLRQRYNEAARWALDQEPQVDGPDEHFTVQHDKGFTSVKYAGGHNEVRLDHSPLAVTFLRNGQPHVVLNERKLFNMEHFRVKTVGEQPEELVVQDPDHPGEQRVIVKDDAFPGFLPPDEDGMWDETFAGKTDSKPKGTLSCLLFLLVRHTDGLHAAQAPSRSASTSRSPATSTSMASPSTHRRSVSRRRGALHFAG